METMDLLSAKKQGEPYKCGKRKKNGFNACDDFFVLIISCYVLAATLSMFKMKYTNDTPSANVITNQQSLWMQSADHRKALLDEICQKVVLTFHLVKQTATITLTRLRSMENSCWEWVVFTSSLLMQFVREMGIVFYGAGINYYLFF